MWLVRRRAGGELLIEPDEIAKRFLPHRLFDDRDALSLHHRAFKTECRLPVTASCPLQEFGCRRGVAPHIRVCEWIERVAQQIAGRVRCRPRRRYGPVAKLKKMIEDDFSLPGACS